MSSFGHKMIYNCLVLQAEIVLDGFLPQKRGCSVLRRSADRATVCPLALAVL
jgi:hypothetical protein